MAAAHLTEWCRIPTSGARAVEPFELDGTAFLAIPQMSYDREGTPPGMNGGDSDTDMLILRRDGVGYAQLQTLPVPGGEDAEFFCIGDQAFLATASIRSGRGPYEFDIESVIFKWNGSKFESFQRIPSFAAKQWRHFALGDRHFLGLAQGIALPGAEAPNEPSRIYEWNGTSFEQFQEIDSKWAYNWYQMSVGGSDFLAHADHVTPSRLYRWDGSRFVEHQDLAAQGGRAFATFNADGDDYLLVACIHDLSRLMRWEGERFVEYQVLDGFGAREFAVVHSADDLYVVRVNFIHGTPADPTTALRSQVYRWRNARLAVVEEFDTFGGTDAAVITDDAGTLVAVSNSLTPDLHFSTDTVVYRFDR